MVRIIPVSAEDLRGFRPALIALLTDAVNTGSSVNFLAPLDPDIARGFWEKVEREAASGGRVVLLALLNDEVVGCIHLVVDTPPNGQHRAEVQKMLVHSRHRRQGYGRALLAAVETEAKARGRTLLVLDTERGSSGEALYAACGWQRAGVIPAFASSYDGTHLVDTVLFYRLLKE
jgi:GNAT superfamily N-acetyltransferase